MRNGKNYSKKEDIKIEISFYQCHKVRLEEVMSSLLASEIVIMVKQYLIQLI